MDTKALRGHIVLSSNGYAITYGNRTAAQKVASTIDGGYVVEPIRFARGYMVGVKVEHTEAN